MKSGKEIVLNYCKEVLTNDIDHLQSCKDNEIDIKSGKYLKDNYELSGCPSNYGLDEVDGLCFEEEVKGYQNQKKQCISCWKKALEDNYVR